MGGRGKSLGEILQAERDGGIENAEIEDPQHRAQADGLLRQPAETGSDAREDGGSEHLVKRQRNDRETLREFSCCRRVLSVISASSASSCAFRFCMDSR